MNLKARMALATTLLVALLLGLGVWLQQQSLQQSLKATMARQQFELVTRVADELNRNLLSGQEALQRAAQLIAPEMLGDPAQLSAFLAQRPALLTIYDELIVVSADFRVLDDYPHHPQRHGRDVSSLPHLQTLFATGQPVFSAPFAGKVSGEPLISNAVPIRDAEGKVIASLSGVLRLNQSNLVGSLQQRKIGETGHFAVSTRDRVIIVSRFPERILKASVGPGANPLYDRALGGWAGSEEGVSSYGVPMLMSYAHVAATGWVVGGLLPTEEAYAPIAAARAQALRYLALSVLVVAVVVWLAMHWLLAPLTQLRTDLRRLRAEPERRAGWRASRDEIGAVAQDFFLLVDELELAQRTAASQAAELQSMLDASPLTVARVRDRCLVSANPAFERMFGYRLDEVLGESVARFYPSQEAFAAFGAMLQPALAGGGVAHFEVEYRRASGECFWTQFHSRLLDVTRPELGSVVLIQDISELRRATEELRLAGRVIESSAEGVFITDADHRIVSVNPAFSRLLGHTRGEVAGLAAETLISARHPPELLASLWATLAGEGVWQGELWMNRADGSPCPVWLTINAVRDADEAVQHYVAIFSDITERKASEERIRHLAEHDALTGLPNRVLLADRLRQEILKARRDGKRLGLLFLDLDRFKNINDSLGHPVGDALLREVARRIAAVMRESDTVARPGGDEFVIVLPALDSADDAARVAEKVRTALAPVCVVEGHELSVSASIGICLCPDDGIDAETLVRNADTAMYHSKERGRNTWSFFKPEMNARVQERLSLEHRLRRALERGEFLLHYQPQIDLGTGTLVGVEALLRWREPDGSMIGPDRFIPVAEDSGLILPLGDWVLREACRQNRAWQAAGLPSIPVAVNISAHQFVASDFVERVASVLEETGLAPAALELELTESVMMQPGERALETLHALRALGVGLAVDDFGTGYSSLVYLKRFPLNRLKIDRAFVRDIADDPEDAAIVSTIIALARSLQLKVTAEGVELQEQFGFLQAAGCDDAQGYLFARPLSPELLEEFWRMRQQGK